MLTIGAFEAKTHFASLLAKVAAGEEVTITKHGRPVARMISAARGDDTRARDAVEALRALRRTTTLAGISWKTLRDDGRP